MDKKEIKQKEDKLIMGKYEVPLHTPTAWQPKNSNKFYKIGDLWLVLENSKAIREDAQTSDYFKQLSTLGKKYNIQLIPPHHHGRLELLSRRNCEILYWTNTNFRRPE